MKKKLGLAKLEGIGKVKAMGDAIFLSVQESFFMQSEMIFLIFFYFLVHYLHDIFIFP